jgi:hypothetical protein
MKVATIGSKSNHIRSVITATSDNKVVVTRAQNNQSTNNYTIVNVDIKRVTTNSIYNKESDNALI